MINDFRYAWRTLRQNPGFAATAIISIALAIGANSAIFSLADMLLFRPLPVRDSSHLVTVRSLAPSSSMSSFADANTELSYPDFLDLRDKSRSFEALTAFHLTPAGFAKDDKSQAQFKMGYLVSGNFFQVLGVEPSLGRAFSSDEDQVPGRDAVVVLANDIWKEEFGADRSLIGRRIRLNGGEFSVVGIAPEDFTGAEQFIHPAFFVPSMMASRLDPKQDLLKDRTSRAFAVKGRLKQTVTLKAADAEISALAKGLEAEYPGSNKGVGAGVRTEVQIRLERTPLYGPILVSLFTLVAIVLVIACCNVANLMLSRGRARSREIAVRLAIGASRLRLIRQLMAESLLIGLIGGMGGLLVAQAATDYFARIETVSDAPVIVKYQLDHRLLAFTFMVSVASAVLFGLIPAIRSTKTDLTPSLKSGPTYEPRKRFFGRRALVIAQIAGSLVLLLSGVGVYRNSASMLSGRGFRTDHILTARFDAAVAGYTPERAEDFYKRLTEQSRALPGVKSVALTYSLPLTTIIEQKNVIPEGYQLPSGQRNLSVMSSTVDESYFDILGMPILRGRSFAITDRKDSPRVAVVNNIFAEKYLGADPIGKRVRLENENGPLVEIVGVTATAKYLSIAEPPTGFIYLPLAQNQESRMTLLVQSNGDPASLAGPVREIARSIDSNIPVLGIRTMDDLFQRSTVQAMNMVVTLLGSVSLMGFVLALAGLYAVVAYQVARKTREIGIRIALGAERPQVMRMILKQAASMGLTGVLAGLVLSFALRGAVNAGQGQPQPTDLWLLTLVPIGLFLTTLLAAAAPARDAMRIDPHVALREE